MILTTTSHIEGCHQEILGIVKGSTVRTKNFVRDWFAGLKSIVGGELKGYTEMLNEARNQATDRMSQEAARLGADAIVSVRFGTSSVMAGAAEIIAYGTAVKITRE
ncbi:MAG: YbjQ family protein [Fibrobacteraceae bacterium]|nr:YbjQ family protein [Fibrobacteraceae bacterium]